MNNNLFTHCLIVARIYISIYLHFNADEFEQMPTELKTFTEKNIPGPR